MPTIERERERERGERREIGRIIHTRYTREDRREAAAKLEKKIGNDDIRPGITGIK